MVDRPPSGGRGRSRGRGIQQDQQIGGFGADGGIPQPMPGKGCLIT